MNTPGPWTFESDEDGDMISIVKQDQHVPIAEVYTPNSHGCIEPEDEEKVWEECKANARLIAAAPETRAERDALLAVARAAEGVTTHNHLCARDLNGMIARLKIALDKVKQNPQLKAEIEKHV